MKQTKIIYWVSTILFALLMVFSSIGHVMSAPEAVTFMNSLGYPSYLLPFLGVAKILGVIALFIPGFPRVKEWAYAGLAYDLIGALFSIIALHGIQPDMAFFILPIGTMIVSYIYNAKLQSTK